VNGSAAYYDNVNTAIMDQQACISPSWGTVTALKLVYAAFDMPQQGEVDRPVTATGTAAIFGPSLNPNTVFSGPGVPSGSTVLNTFSGTALGANGISVGQVISTSGAGIANGTYVAGVVNSFVAGSGNTPNTTIVTLSAPTTASTSSGQPFTFTGLFVPVKFGGKRSFIVEPGHDVVTSDPVSIVLPPSSWFMVRSSAVMSSAGLQIMDMPYSSRLTETVGGVSFLEFDNRGTSLNDLTMSPAGLSNTGGGYWGPVTLLAQVTVTPGQSIPGAALILGDSIAAGTGDLPDGLGLEGYIQRSLENNVPFVTAARGSTTANGLLAHGDGQYALAIDTGITDVFLEDGRNDIEQFSTPASQLEVTIKSIVGRYVMAGKRAWCFSVPPTTYSNDGWVTAANQSFPSAVALSGTAITPSGSTQIILATVAGVVAGQSAGLNLSTAGAVAAGTTVTAVNNTTLAITISTPTTAALPASTKLYFGTTAQSGSPIEVQRTAYNAYLRGNWRSVGCSGLIDIDGIVSDQVNQGKWRTDLGQGSSDGVHPSAALHQAAVNAGLISPAMLAVP
jgi:lysophospholipase L1-like esterase